MHNENIRTQVEASNSTPYPVIRPVLDDRNLEQGKNVLRIDQGSSAGYRRIWKQARANRKGVERKDAARRLTRAREPWHLMCLPRSHLTRQSRKA